MRKKPLFAKKNDFFTLVCERQGLKPPASYLAIPTRVLFLHTLTRKHLAVLQCHLHHILPCRKTLQIEAFEAIALRAHDAALQVVKLYGFGRYIRGELQVKLVLGGVGVEEVGADLDSSFLTAYRAVRQHLESFVISVLI